MGTYLYTYVEAAIGETSQDVDPEDGDFQVPWLSFVGPFSAPLGQLFYMFSLVFCFFCSLLGPSFGSQKWTQKWASDSNFNRILIVEARVGHILGSIFGAHFWAPDL